MKKMIFVFLSLVLVACSSTPSRAPQSAHFKGKKPLSGNGNVDSGGTHAEKVARQIKEDDTRTVVKEIENKEENPCMSAGKVFVVELQVKKAWFDRLKQEVTYSWETVKKVHVDQDGSVMEVCAE